MHRSVREIVYHVHLLSSEVYFRLTEEQFWKNYFYRVSLIKQSLQANSAIMKDPEQDTGAEHLPHDSEQHDMKNDIAGMGCVHSMQGILF